MKKWQIVDLVRSFSIVAVLATHSYTNPPFSHPWMCWLWGRFCVNGYNGVTLFFVVSGFLITHVIAKSTNNLFKPDIFKFYVQRIGRIWPLYFLSIFIGLFIFGLASTSSDLYLGYFPSEIHNIGFWLTVPTFTLNWFLSFYPQFSIGLPWILLWSISIEEQFYLLYPFILLKAKRPKTLIRLIAGIIGLALLSRGFGAVFYPGSKFIQSFPSIVEFDLISIGILLYLAHERFGAYFSKNKRVSGLVCLGGLCLTLLFYFRSSEPSAVYRIKEIWIPDAIGFGLFAFLLGGLHLDVFESKFLRILCLPGKYCYGCYLFHSIVLIILRPFLNQMNVLLGLFIFVCLTTLVSVLSYHYFEAPLNHLIRKRFQSI